MGPDTRLDPKSEEGVKDNDLHAFCLGSLAESCATTEIGVSGGRRGKIKNFTHQILEIRENI